MFAPFERMVAMRYLRPRRQEGFISVIAGFSLLGIALGVATLIIVMSVMNGFRHELLSRILGLNGHIAVVSITGQVEDFDAAAETVRAIDGVARVTPLVVGQALASSQVASSGAIVRGIRPADFGRNPLLADSIVAGSLDDFGARNTTILGDRLARQLRVAVGESLTLISPQGSVTAFGTVPRMATYRVAATFNVDDARYDSALIFLTLEAAQVFYRLEDAVSRLEVVIDEEERLKDIGRRIIEQRIAGAYVVDWEDENASFFNALQVERNVMFLILTLIILVAALNIISSLIMLVKDKGRDIAILRTMGATRGAVMRVFLMSGAAVGVMGTLAGLGLGLLFTDNIGTIEEWLQGLTGVDLFAAEIYFLSRLPAIIDPVEVTEVVVMSLALSFLATLYPSWRAARLDPVVALRNE